MSEENLSLGQKFQRLFWGAKRMQGQREKEAAKELARWKSLTSEIRLKEALEHRISWLNAEYEFWLKSHPLSDIEKIELDELYENTPHGFDAYAGEFSESKPSAIVGRLKRADDLRRMQKRHADNSRFF